MAGKSVHYSQIATVWPDGQRMVAPDAERKDSLKKADISETKLRMLLRDNAEVWILWSE